MAMPISERMASSRPRHRPATCGVTEYMRALAIISPSIVAFPAQLHNGHIFLWACPASTIGPVLATPPSLQSSLLQESASHEETEIPQGRFPCRRRAAFSGPTGPGSEG